MKNAKIILALFALFAVPALGMAGERVSVGLYSSVKGFGASIDFPSRSVDYYTLSLQADMFECFINQGNRIGGKAVFCVNHVFHRTQGRVQFSFHAGPGVSTGWCPDFDSTYGIVLALAGNIGCRAEFDAGVAIDFGFTLELGGHLRTSDGVGFGWYRGGLYGFPAPEIRIYWMFK